MKVFKMRWFFLAFMILFMFITYIIMSKRLHVTNENCIKPFHEFAYLPDQTARPIPEILPDHPWEVEATIPVSDNIKYRFPDIQIKLGRTKNGKEEIWLFKSPFDSWTGTVNREGAFIIYRPQSQTWIEISALVENTNLIVQNLFITSDGTIWGQIGVDQPHSNPIQVPVLSRFNESTQRFEAADGGLNIPITLNSELLSQPLNIVLDKQDVFWIFGPSNGIYRYNPKTQTTERQTDFPNTEMYRLSTALASDGSIYFQDKSLTETEKFLFQFIPDTKEVVTLGISTKPWESSSGMLVDHKGRLWLGSMGYMETDGNWHLIDPDPKSTFEHTSPYWYPPTLIFESSDGMLWYTEYHDMGLLGEGTAWYDPEADNGCLFTNMASHIIEDAEKQLWMVANGKLYRYALEQ